MKNKQVIGVAAIAAAGLMSFHTALNTVFAKEQTMDLSNQDKAIALLESIESGDQSAVAYVNPQNYKQHNLAVADGLAGFGEALQALPKGSAKVDIVRSFQDGEYVVTHTDYNFFGPKVGFDVFRFEDGLIVEHWDNLDPKATEPNPSGRTQLDGATEIADLDKTQENKALVASFVDSVLVKGQFDKLTDFISQTTYLQHNTAIADGLDGLGAAIAAMEKQGIKMIYETNHAVLGQGNFVLTISEGKFAGDHVSFYDLFRVEDGKIVEHWDVIEKILPKEQQKHNNGKFGFEYGNVIEVATFDLKAGVDASQFSELDKAVEESYVSQQPGFISRESGLSEGGYWRVVVNWDSFESADSSMAKFMDASAAGAFLDSADTSTMIMRRYKSLK